MALKNTISIAGLSGALLTNMNASSSLATLNAMMAAAAQKDDADALAAANALTTAVNTINQSLAGINQELSEVRSLAEILSGNELTQLEALLRQLIDSTRMQALFDGLCVTVGGSSYSAKSLVAALATMDKELEGEFTYDANNAVSGYNMTLAEDGLIVPFVATITDDVEAGTRTIVFATDDFRGVPADFQFVFLKRSTTVSRFGQSFSEVSYDHKYHRNLLLNLNAAACTATADPVPDVDGDGDNTGANP